MPRRRPRTRLPLLWAVISLGIAIAAYVLGLSWYQAQGTTLLEPHDLYIPRTIDVVVALWCFWIGSSIGSFLNVVAWRMPRGETLNGRSHCPRCCSQLKARDNFPVFGWLALGGRCRVCRLPISPRYPIVEAAVGISLSVVAIGQLYRISLPHQGFLLQGPLWAPVIDRDVLLTLLYHTVALAVSWAFGLIRLDGHPLPRRLTWFGLLVAIVPMLADPGLQVVSWQARQGGIWSGDGMYLDAIVRVLTSLVAAAILGRSLARGLCPAADPKLDPLGRSTTRLMDSIAILAVPTILVGWQASPALTMLATVIAAGSAHWLPPRIDALGRFAIAMPIALTIQLAGWRLLHQSPWWPSDDSSPWVILSWAAVILFVPLYLREPTPPVTASSPSSGGDPAAATAIGDRSDVDDNEQDFEGDLPPNPDLQPHPDPQPNCNPEPNRDPERR